MPSKSTSQSASQQTAPLPSSANQPKRTVRPRSNPSKKIIERTMRQSLPKVDWVPTNCSQLPRRTPKVIFRSSRFFLSLHWGTFHALINWSRGRRVENFGSWLRCVVNSLINAMIIVVVSKWGPGTSQRISSHWSLLGWMDGWIDRFFDAGYWMQNVCEGTDIFEFHSAGNSVSFLQQFNDHWSFSQESLYSRYSLRAYNQYIQL